MEVFCAHRSNVCDKTGHEMKSKIGIVTVCATFLSPNHRFKGFFIHILINGRPQFNKISIYGPRKIAFY